MDDESDFINSNINIISRGQIKLLQTILSSKKLKSLEENEISMKSGNLISNFIQDLNQGLWTELKTSEIKIGPYREELQIAYINFLKIALLKENIKSQLSHLVLEYNKYFYSNYTSGIIFEQLDQLQNSIKKVKKNHLMNICRVIFNYVWQN